MKNRERQRANRRMKQEFLSMRNDIQLGLALYTQDFRRELNRRMFQVHLQF